MTDAAPLARETIFGAQEERILERLAQLDPDLMAYIRDFAYDTVYQRGGLDLKTKELLACVLLTSLGSPPELRTHLRGAMRAGASEQEVRETLLYSVPRISAHGGGFRATARPACQPTKNLPPRAGGAGKRGLTAYKDCAPCYCIPRRGVFFASHFLGRAAPMTTLARSVRVKSPTC